LWSSFVSLPLSFNLMRELAWSRRLCRFFLLLHRVSRLYAFCINQFSHLCECSEGSACFSPPSRNFASASAPFFFLCLVILPMPAAMLYTMESFSFATPKFLDSSLLDAAQSLTGWGVECSFRIICRSRALFFPLPLPVP